jgi:hypothetical protein
MSDTTCAMAGPRRAAELAALLLNDPVIRALAEP